MQDDIGKLDWNTFVRFVKQWAEDRNLIKGSTAQAQALKGLSELGELADNLAKGKCIKDDIGDNCVVAVIVDTINGHTPRAYNYVNLDTAATVGDAAQDWALYLQRCAQPTDVPSYMQGVAELEGIDFEECLFTAWNDIKDRKGVMYNGVFVKENDERYNAIMAELGK